MSDDKKISELIEIKKKFQNDGIDALCSDEEKLLHLWHLYVKTQGDFAASLENTQQLRQQHEEEMREVENYVEHIRNLSDEREALTIEFEQENDGLKQEIAELHDQLQANKSEETSEMLLQQGLEEVAQGTVGEQVAYLLVERARLLDELEAEQARAIVDTPDGPMAAEQLLQMLEHERGDFEEELSHQRESMKAVKEQMKHMHEEEVNSLVNENEHLQKLLDQSNEKINSLDSVIMKMQESLKERMEEAVKSLKADQQSAAETEGGESTQIEELKETVRTMEEDNRTLIDNIKSLGAELESEKSQHENTISLKERTTRRLQIEIDQQKQTIEQLEGSVKTLTDERDTLKESKLACDDVDSDAHNRLKQSIKQVQSEKSETQSELETIRDDLKAEQEKSSRLKEQVEKTEEEARNQRRHFDKKETDFRSKVKSLESQVESLEDEISTRDRQHQLSERDLKKTISNLRTDLEVELGKSRQEQKRRQHMETNFSEHRMQNAQNLLELETLTTQLNNRVSELEEKVKNLTEERDSIAKDLELKEVNWLKSENRLREVQEKVSWLENTSSLLAEENTQLHQQVQTLKEDTADGAQKQMSESETNTVLDLVEMENMLKQLQEENQTIHEQLQSREAEIESLKQQLEEGGVKDELTDRDKEINELKQDLEEREMLEEEVSDKNKQIQELKRHLAEREMMEEELEDKDDEISTLKTQQQSLHDQLKHQEEQLKSLSNQQVKDRLNLEQQLKQKDEQILVLTEQLKQTESLSTTSSDHVQQLKHSHHQEVSTLGARIEQLTEEKHQLTLSLNHRQQELTTAASRLETAERLHSQSDSIRIPQLQSDNSTLQEKLSKSETQVIDLNRKVLKLESANDRLKTELQRKKQECIDWESRMSSRNIDHNSMLKQVQSRADSAENKASKLQEELSRALSRLDNTEQRLHQASTLRQKLQSTESEVISLRSQLQDEKLHKTVASQDDIRGQLSAFRERERELTLKNSQLQHNLVDLERKQELMQENVQTQTQMREAAEKCKQSLSVEVMELQRYVNQLKHDLQLANQQYDSQVARYNDRRLRTKNKLQRAREIYNLDKQKLREELERVRHDHELAEAKLRKENEWRDTMETGQSRLLKEKRQLLTQLTDIEETQRDQKRSLAMVQVRCKYLEEENHSLQQRIDSLTLQKHNLERVLKEFQTEAVSQEHNKQITPLQFGMSSTPRSAINNLLDNHNHQANHMLNGGEDGQDPDDTVLSSMSDIHSDVSAT